MEEKIKKKIEELWEKIEFELERFEECYSGFKEFLKERNLGGAHLDICFAVMHLRNVEEALEDIEMLTRLLIE